MKTLLLRKKGFGLDSLRKLNELMTSETFIRNNQSVPATVDAKYIFLWGYVNNPPNNRAGSESIYLNKPSNVGFVSDKKAFRLALWRQGLTMESTNALEHFNETNLNETNPWVVRPKNHYGGTNLYLVKNMAELRSAITACGSNWYASRYIKKTSEYRVFVTSGRVSWVVKKIPDDVNAVAWNVNQGGRFENVGFGSWNLSVLKKAIDAMMLARLDFGAVDLIVDEQGNCYVLEINTAPSIKSDYWAQCTAKSFDYIVNNGADILPVIEGVGWRGYIHPAISSEAMLRQPEPPEEDHYFVKDGKIRFGKERGSSKDICKLVNGRIQMYANRPQTIDEIRNLCDFVVSLSGD